MAGTTGTTVTAERIFDSHAVALGLPKLGEVKIADYAAKLKASDEATRCLTAAFDAASIANHADVHTWLAQARQHIKNPFPPDRR